MIRNIESIKNELLITALKAVEHKVTPGGVIGVVYGNGQRITIPFGRYTYEENSKIVKEDTMYDLASITKSIPTNSIALKLIDEGKLKLYDKLIDYIPEFNNSDRDRVMIKHLLTYSLDGYGLASLGTNKMNYNVRPNKRFKIISFENKNIFRLSSKI